MQTISSSHSSIWLQNYIIVPKKQPFPTFYFKSSQIINIATTKQSPTASAKLSDSDEKTKQRVLEVELYGI